MAGKKITVLGSSNTDMIIKTRRLPRPGETVLGGQFLMAAGGKGANQAVAAARAGGDVTFIARVGDDMFGRQAIEGFGYEGIHTDYIIKDRESPSGIALIFVAEDGENSIAVASGANGRLSPGDVERAKEVIITADILLMQLEIPLETVRAAARMAFASSVRVILNPAPAQPLEESLFKQISILTPNETEAELLTGLKIETERDVAKAAKVLLSGGTGAILITLGPKGVYAAAPGTSEVVPGFKVRAVDTTAAGDVFNGALAVALAENAPLTEAARFANAAGALSVTKMGAQPSVPFRPDIESFLRNNVPIREEK